MIESLEEAFRRNVHERATAARAELQACVRPIVASVDGTRPYPLGTCILIEIDGSRFVVTAAHVLDESPAKALFVIGRASSQPVQIRGKIVSSAPPLGGRRRDKIDIGFWPIPSSAQPMLGKVRFLSEADFSLNRVSSGGRQYMAMGYPYSRNMRRIDHARGTITPSIRTYTAETVRRPELAAELKVSGDDHFFLHFEKTSSYADGSHANTFTPSGMSGGPLVDLGRFDSVEKHLPSHRMGRVAAILIEWHKKHRAIVALKIEHVIRILKMGWNAGR
jgi:hypothetical protein